MWNKVQIKFSVCVISERVWAHIQVILGVTNYRATSSS